MQVYYYFYYYAFFVDMTVSYKPSKKIHPKGNALQRALCILHWTIKLINLICELIKTTVASL